MIASLLAVHLLSTAGALVAFWTSAWTRKGGGVHRRVGRWFARAIAGAAATGGVLALAGIINPAAVARGSEGPSDARHWMFFLLYLLVVIAAPVQHGLAVIAAGPAPARVRSLPHMSLNVVAIFGAVVLLAAAVAWRTPPFLLAVPAGFTVGVRNMRYASQSSAHRTEWEREHLTSLLSAGIGLHTALFVLLARSWPESLPADWQWAPWLLPAVIGVPLMVWLRRRRSGGQLAGST